MEVARIVVNGTMSGTVAEFFTKLRATGMMVTMLRVPRQTEPVSSFMNVFRRMSS